MPKVRLLQRAANVPSGDPLVGPRTHTFDARQMTIVPGFIDAHNHAPGAILLYEVIVGNPYEVEFPQTFQPCFFADTGTGTPEIFTLTAPSWFRAQKLESRRAVTRFE